MAILMLTGPSGIRGMLTLGLGYGGMIAALASVAALIRIAVRMIQGGRGRDESMAMVIRAAMLRHWRMDRGASLWIPLVTFVLVMASFTLFKQRLLPKAGFGFGPTAAAIDHAILGMDGWQLTHGLMASPWWSQGIDLLYHAWFAPMTLGVVLCAFARPGSLLAWRYMLAYVLQWVVQGTVVAWMLPAAGPRYFVEFQAEFARFMPLLTRLRAQDAWLEAAGAPGLSALDFQNQLLRLYTSGELMVGGGISAMPSLHNAMAVLFTCAAFHLGRGAGLAFACFAVAIWVGSIHLGWHYAIDGVVASAGTMVIWKLTGVLGHIAVRRQPMPVIVATPVAAAPVAGPCATLDDADRL